MNRVFRCTALFAASFLGLWLGGTFRPDSPIFDGSLVFGHDQYIELRRFLVQGFTTALCSAAAARLLRLDNRVALSSALLMGLTYVLLMIIRNGWSELVELTAYYWFAEPFLGFTIAALSVFGLSSMIESGQVRVRKDGPGE